MPTPFNPGYTPPQQGMAPSGGGYGAANLSVQLPWQQLAAQGNAFAGLGQDPQAAMAGLGNAYNQSYQGALNLNQSLFSGIQTGYEALRGKLDSDYADIHKGYQDVYGDVLGRLAGTNQSSLNDINTAYDAQAGGSLQNSISRGLGNSTVAQNMQRGVEMDRQRALLASNSQFGQLQAGYASSLGQAGLGAQQQGAQLGANLGQNQLQWLNSVQAPYPNAQMYSQLAQMYGANQQRQDDQGQFNRGASGFGWGGGVGAGGTTSGTGSYNPAVASRLGSYGGGGSSYAPQQQSGYFGGQMGYQGYAPQSGYGGMNMEGGNDPSFGDEALQGAGYDLGQYGYEGDPGSMGAGYYGDYGEYFGE